MDIDKIEKRIEAIKRELSKLGPMHPGSVSKQFNICGTPGCQCKAKKNPKKHGPYYQLSYTWKGRHSTRFVRPDQAKAMQNKVKNHKRFRALVEEWIALSVQQEQLEREKEKRDGR
jgi:hypothetical protein